MTYLPNLVSQTPAVYIVTANKQLIDALLAMNTSNRAVRRTAVDRLKEDIQNGKWMLTASGIGVSTEGIVTDGQHRLLAIKEAGYPPVQFILCVGLNPASQGVVDRHAKRSLADALTLVQGRTFSTGVVAASNVLLTVRGSTSQSQTFSGAGAIPSDGTAAANVLMWEEEMTAVLSVAGTAVRSPVIAALAVYMRHEPDAAIEFADQIKRGVGLQEDDPAYRLREVLKTITKGGSTASVRSFGLTVTAIVAHARQKKLKMLKMSESWEGAPFRPWKA